MARPEWISVKDALPKDNEYVLVYDSNNGFYNIDCFYNGDWLEIHDYWTEDVKVTHWMPLPEPPDMVDYEA